jgi:transcriptional regulator with XRE-family HTH domain
MKFDKLFYDLRKSLGINQTQMAKKLKMTQGGVSKIEAGEMPPNVDTFIRAYRIASKHPIAGIQFVACLYGRQK